MLMDCGPYQCTKSDTCHKKKSWWKIVAGGVFTAVAAIATLGTSLIV